MYGQEGRLWVRVWDAVGRTKEIESTFLITGAPQVEPLTLSVQLDKASVKAGQSIKAAWQAGGGTGGYQYEFEWGISVFDIEENYEVMGSVELVYQTTQTNASFTPTYGSRGDFIITVGDADGRETVEFLEFIIEDGESSVSLPNATLTLSPQTGKTGNSINVSVQTTGGSAPYQYAYEWWIYSDTDNLLSRDLFYKSEAFENSAQHTITLPEGKKGRVFLQIRDAEGHIGYGYSDYFVIAPADPVATKPGDANNDNTIDILDLVSIIDHIVSNTSPASKTNADANGDGAVDILDLVWIIARIVGG